MATAKVYIDPNAFGAGKPLYGVVPIKARVQIGKADQNSNMTGGAVGVRYVDQSLDRLVGRSSITVTVNPLEVDSVQMGRWPQQWKNSMADLVRKGAIVVENPAGTPLPPAAILSMSAEVGPFVEDLSAQVDGVETAFTLSFGYVSGSLIVFWDGVQQAPGAVDITETSPTTGVFTLSDPPPVSTVMTVFYSKA